MSDEMREILQTSYEDELEVHEKYCKLSHEAKENGCCKMAKILKDMAHEEKTHACFLKQMLEEF